MFGTADSGHIREVFLIQSALYREVPLYVLYSFDSESCSDHEQQFPLVGYSWCPGLGDLWHTEALWDGETQLDVPVHVRGWGLEDIGEGHRESKAITSPVERIYLYPPTPLSPLH